ncbi:Peptide chain release factor 1, mitochondrial [Linum grandiflorum]
MDLITELRTKQKEIDGLKSMLSECVDEKEMIDMTNEELDHALNEEKRIQSLLLKSLLPKDDADERDCPEEATTGCPKAEGNIVEISDSYFHGEPLFSPDSGFHIDYGANLGDCSVTVCSIG